jgi:hypothetical protein
MRLPSHEELVSSEPPPYEAVKSRAARERVTTRLFFPGPCRLC